MKIPWLNAASAIARQKPPSGKPGTAIAQSAVPGALRFHRRIDMVRLRADLTGIRVGRLLVLDFAELRKGKPHWNCRCDCGVEKAVAASSLMHKTTISCGCKRRSREDLKSRLMRKIEIDHESGCWNWIGQKNRDGYGALKVALGSRELSVMRGAHRVSFEAFKGEIADGLEVCHSCDNPSCINPDHLWAGTHQENMDDMRRKGRSKLINAYGAQSRAKAGEVGHE